MSKPHHMQTPEHRARQAQAIRTWKPWEAATGPKTPEGKARSAANRKLAQDRAARELERAQARYAKLHGGKLPEPAWLREVRDIFGAIRSATGR